MLNRYLSLKLDSRVIMLYVVIFFSIFGPKFFGVLDVSIITNLIIIGVYICLNIAHIRKYSIELFLLVMLIIAYSLVVCAFTQNISIVFLAKFIRVTTSVIAMGLFIDSIKLTKMELVNCLINILLIHAIIVIVSATFFLELQNILKPFTGFHLRANRFRSTGLTNGFDFSGLLCVWGVILVSLYPRKLVLKKRLFKLVVFMGASLLTSRITMLVLEATIIYIALLNKKLNRKVKSLLIIILMISFLPVVGIFLFSTGNYDNFIVKVLLNVPYFSTISEKLIYYYAKTDIGNTVLEHYSFSGLSVYEIFFGAMKEAHRDPGYTQYIYYIGVVGVLLVFCFYVYIYIKARNKVKINNSIENKYLYKNLLIFVVLCFCLSMKNSYLLARHVTEIILILTCILYKKQDMCN